MQQVSRPSGVSLTAPDTWLIRDAGEPPRPASRGIRGRVFGPVPMPVAGTGTTGGSTQADAETLVSALCAQDMILVDQIGLEASPTASVTRSDPGAGQGGTAELSLSLAPDEGAVVLLEQDGVYSWQFGAPVDAPQPSRSRSIGEAAPRRTVRFQIEFGVKPSTAPTHRRGWVADLLIGQARAFVLKFVARAAVGQALKYLERNVRRGLVCVNSDDPTTWPCVEDASHLALPEDRPARVLLLVHGTFSSTTGSFGGLGATPWGREFLATARAGYDAVIGFDHATLEDDPLTNARDLLRRLEARTWAHRPVIDAISYSRGGIVLRSLLEHLLPASPKFSPVQCAVFVGAVNAGTLLAKPDNWHTLIDLYTNLAAAACRAIALFPHATAAAGLLRELIQGVGTFAKHLATHVVTEGGIPGLAAMDPDGDFIRRLNATQPNQPGAEDSQYFAITSNFSPRLALGGIKDLPRQLVVTLADGLVDQLMGEGNDLVVNTASMTAIDPQAGGFIKDQLGYGKNSVVYHTNYFLQPQTTAALMQWLKLHPPTPTLATGLSRRFKPFGAPAIPLETVPLSMEELVELAQRTADVPTEPAKVRRGVPVFAPSEAGAGVGLPAPALPKMPMAPGPLRPTDPGSSDPVAAASPNVTCHFHAEMDAEVQLARTTTVEVTLSREEIHRAVHAAAAGGSGKVDPSRQLIVQVLAKVNFQCVGESRVELAPPSPGQPLSLYFDVQATSVGEGELWVIIRQGQVPLANLILRPRIVARRAAAAGRISAPASAEEAGRLTEPLHQLSIFERRNGTEVFYQFIFDSPALGLKSSYDSKAIRGERAVYVQQLYKEIENRWLSSQEDAAVFQEELRAFGAQLWDELIPAELQRELWEHRDQIRSVMIFSEEPFVPWELVHLKAPGRPLGSEPLFFAQKGVVRWLHNLGWPPDHLTFRAGRCRYVIPRYPHPDYRLPEAEAETAFLTERFQASAVEPQPAPVRRLLGEVGAFDLLHFAGHGVAESENIANAQLLLEGRVEQGNYLPAYLSATTVEQFANLQNADGTRPVVVLNACQAGRAGYKLCAIGGFARAFLSRGAGLFVGCLWSAGDRPARHFTEKFYERLLAGETVAEATIAAREAARAAGDATWLAYVVYGHPHARQATKS